MVMTNNYTNYSYIIFTPYNILVNLYIYILRTYLYQINKRALCIGDLKKNYLFDRVGIYLLNI